MTADLPQTQRRPKLEISIAAFQIWEVVRGKAKLQRAKQEAVSTAAI